MKRLCEDLMIPNDKSFDDQFYGSRCKAVSTYSHQTWRDNKEGTGIFYNETNPMNNYPKRGINQIEMISKKYQGYTNILATSSSALKTQNLESPETDRFEDKPSVPLRKDDHPVKKLANPQHDVPFATNARQEKEIPDVDGYFSDFTNDTDNDIEEEFDFD